MARVHSFAPVAGRGASLLILGSMPGRASLEAGEYYAHPRNSFWPIVTAILGGPAGLPYGARLRLLRSGGIALWDVLGSCVRAGSADSAIRRASVRPNGFAEFFRRHSGIKRVLFNGGKAEECYKRYVLPSLPASCAVLEYLRLPSTSPAHASLPRAVKYKVWEAAIRKRRQKGGRTARFS